jgi:hypothetical protein
MKNDLLLSEVEDILRTMPSRDELQKRSPESQAWVGRAAAAIVRWEMPRTYMVDAAVDDIQRSLDTVANVRGFAKITALLHQARADLRMDVGSLSVVVQQGQVFDYFDEVRKAIELARLEVFFVDPYLDAEFVSRYLPHVVHGTAVRLLSGPKRMPTLLPAVDAFARQSGVPIQVRSSTDIHDRYLFVDKSICYLSGASFKDGARNAPAVLTQIADAFQAMWNTYDGLWSTAKAER